MNHAARVERADREQRLGGALRRWLLALLLGWVGAACAQDHVTERAWLEEAPGETLTLQQAQMHGGQLFDRSLSRGYGPGAVWVRLRIDPDLHPPGQRQLDELVLRMQPVYIDDIQVFDPLVSDGLAGRLGDRQPPWLDAMWGQDFLLPIPRGKAPRDIWLRLESTSSRQIHAEVLNFSGLNAALLRQGLLFALYVGLVGLLLIWGLIRWVMTRELLMGVFVYKELGALLFALGSMGFLRIVWPPALGATTLDPLVSAFSILAVGGGALFHLVFLREFRPPRWSMAALAFVSSASPVLLLLALAGHARLALSINMWLVLVIPLLVLANAVLARGWAHPDPAQHPVLPRGVVIGFYVLFTLLLISGSAVALALAPASPFAIYVVQVHGLVSAILLQLMLQFRGRRREHQRQQALVALERSRLQTEHDRQLHEEQKKLLAMLAHEIKTPLATMHMRLDVQAAGGLEIRRAMRDMNAVIDRCMQTARLGDGELAAHRESTEASGIVRDAIAACSQPERLRADLPPQLHLQTDRQLLSIVLGNLLENACKYSPEDTPIELSVRSCQDERLGPALRLEVRNRPGGAGWPDPDLVFQKYYRSPQARRRAGTGLGLYLVRSLALTLGGRIDYLPRDGWIGFVLMLPLPGVPAALAAAQADGG